MLCDQHVQAALHSSLYCENGTVCAWEVTLEVTEQIKLSRIRHSSFIFPLSGIVGIIQSPNSTHAHPSQCSD